MRIENEYKKTGYFWLPDKSDKKIPGTLSITDGGKVELEVVGLFNDRIETFNKRVDLKRIIGHVEKDGLLTLEDCLYTRRRVVFGGISKSHIYVHRVLSGVAYDKDEEVNFNTLSFSIECMDEWLNVSGLNIQINTNNNNTIISYSPPNNFSYSLSNGMKLEVCFAYTLPTFANITEAKITQRAYFKLISDNLKPLTDFTKIAHKLTHLLSFAVDTTVSLKGLIAKSNEIQQDSGNGKFNPVPINIYYESIPFSEKVPNVNRHQMIFTFEDIIKNAENVFNKWIDAYDTLDSALELYFSTKIGVQKYLEGKFLVLVQGLETFHRRTSNEKIMDEAEYEILISEIMKNCPEEKVEWLEGKLKYGNEVSLSKRIKKIIDPFKEHFGNSNDRGRMLRKIIDTRNYYTHYNEELKAKTASGKELWKLCLRMEAIFQLHFLKVIGFTEEGINNIVKDRSLKRKLDGFK